MKGKEQESEAEDLKMKGKEQESEAEDLKMKGKEQESEAEDLKMKGKEQESESEDLKMKDVEKEEQENKEIVLEKIENIKDKDFKENDHGEPSVARYSTSIENQYGEYHKMQRIDEAREDNAIRSYRHPTNVEVQINMEDEYTGEVRSEELSAADESCETKEEGKTANISDGNNEGTRDESPHDDNKSGGSRSEGLSASDESCETKEEGRTADISDGNNEGTRDESPHDDNKSGGARSEGLSAGDESCEKKEEGRTANISDGNNETVEKSGESSQPRFEDTNFKEGEFTDVTDESGNSSEIKGEGRNNGGINQTGRGEVHRTMATIELTREDGQGRTNNDNNISDTRNQRRTNDIDDQRTPQPTTQNRDNAEDEQVSSEWKSKDWIDAFNGLQVTTGYAVGLVVGFILFGLFGGKALGDSDRCDGGTGISVKVFSYALGAIICLSVSLFLIPHITVHVRGLNEGHMAERRKRTRRSYIFINLILMFGYIWMYLATFYFVQVRLGAWWCLSATSHVLIMSIGVALCVLEVILVRSLYYVFRA